MPDLTPADIERLLELEAKYRAAPLDDATAGFEAIAAKSIRPLAERVRKLEAENAQLREALEKIADETAATWVCDIARAALAQKEERSCPQCGGKGWIAITRPTPPAWVECRRCGNPERRAMP